MWSGSRWRFLEVGQCCCFRGWKWRPLRLGRVRAMQSPHYLLATTEYLWWWCCGARCWGQAGRRSRPLASPQGAGPETCRPSLCGKGTAKKLKKLCGQVEVHWEVMKVCEKVSYVSSQVLTWCWRDTTWETRCHWLMHGTMKRIGCWDCHWWWWRQHPKNTSCGFDLGRIRHFWWRQHPKNRWGFDLGRMRHFWWRQHPKIVVDSIWGGFVTLRQSQVSRRLRHGGVLIIVVVRWASQALFARRRYYVISRFSVLSWI